MSKKKKSKTKQKYNTIKKKYSVPKLQNMAAEYKQREQSGEELSEFDQKFYQAIQRTLDFTKDAFDDGIKLDFNMETEQNLDVALANIGAKMQEKGIEEEEIIKFVMETAALYQLFELVNLQVRFTVNSDIYLDHSVSDNLIIKANMPMNPEVHTFDPLEAMRRVADTCFVFKGAALSEQKTKNLSMIQNARAFGVCLDDFRNIVTHDFLEQL